MLTRVLVGTIVYVVIVVMAAPFPAAAGLTLIFPALNGLAFFFAQPSSVARMTKSMLWMPVINGCLCAGYMGGFLLLTKLARPDVLGWSLMAVVVAAWTLIVFRRHVRRGIEQHQQFGYAMICTLGGLAAVAAVHALLGASPLQQGLGGVESIPGSWQWVAGVIGQNRVKVGLFALALAGFLISERYWPISDEARGVLAGMPLVPFGGMLSVAVDGGLDPDVKLRIFAGMLAGVGLAPAPAVWFVYGFSRYLTGRRARDTATLDRAARFAGLLAGWALCASAIAAISWGLRLFP